MSSLLGVATIDAALGVTAVDAALAVVLLALATMAAGARPRPGATAATALFLALAAAVASAGLGRIGLVSATDALRGAFAGWLAAVPLWAAFAFAYTARGPAVTRRRAVAAGVYAAATGLGTEAVGALDGTLALLVQVAVSVAQTSLVGLGVFGGFLLLYAAAAGDLPLGEAALLAVGGVAASLALFPLAVAPPGATSVPAALTGALAVSGGAFVTVTFRYRPLSGAPGAGYLGREAFLAETREAVVVTDREGRIADANAAAERLFGAPASRVAGRSVADVVGALPDGEGTATVETQAGRRTVDVSRSTLASDAGEPIGTAYLFRDVTERTLQRQRLAVLERVLRHNLRNDLDAIRGFAEVLAEGDAGGADAARRIRALATDLEALGATVERADRVTTRADLDHDRVDVVTVVDAVAADARGAAPCRVDVAAGDDVGPIRTDPVVLRAALVELVENAVDRAATAADAGGDERSDSSDGTDDHPAVTVTVSDDSGGVRVAVRSDGPPVPDRERAVVRDGEETQLRHGTGVGLWLASWAATRLGGAVDFEATDDDERIVFRVPDRPPADEAA